MPEAKKDFYIREWGHVVCAEKDPSQVSADEIHISKAAWQELAKYADETDKNKRYLDYHKSNVLRIKNFVGVISAKDGTQIEILPKTSEEELDKNQLEESRDLIWRMLNVVQKLNWIETTDAKLKTRKQPLYESLIQRFLLTVRHIVRRGIRFDYHRVKAHEPFLKGQLQTAKQFNEPPHKQHLFHIEYDEYSANRAENRLIHSALIQALKWAKTNANKKLARELLLFFDCVPESQNIDHDLKKFRSAKQDRSMYYYQNTLPWLQLILNKQNPFALKDKNAGISFLFPMEVLFEKYVAKILAKRLPKEFQLTEQKPMKYLAASGDKKVFQMKPDIVISKGNNPIAILDTKWKLIDENKTYENDKIDEKKGISQSDMYQLFAYGKKYDVQKLALIYPQWSGFKKSFKFEFDENLHLRIVPFSLDNEVKMIDFMPKLPIKLVRCKCCWWLCRGGYAVRGFAGTFA